MNAPETHLRLIVPTLIAPSPTNPRKRQQNEASNLKRWRLPDLADNIRELGVIEPIVVRGNPAFVDGNGMPPWELVAGERRWRASQLAGLEAVPAIVRRLTDFEVLKLQISENVHNEPLHAIEEADHYRLMLDAPGGYADADALAASLGKSKRYVYNRLDLLKLCPEARAACLADEISASVALEIANGIPSHADQVKALAEAKRGWADEPMSARATRAHIAKTYNLRLDQARFDPEAKYHSGATLDWCYGPAPTGKCTDCPKRTGANPDFFDDVKTGDLCQDAVCFQGKTAAAREQLLEAARSEGATVINGPEAKRLMPASGKPTGYQLLDKPCIAFSDHPKALRDAVGNAIESKDYVLIDVPESDAPVVAVRDDVAQRALKSKGLLKITMPIAAAKPKTGPRKNEAPPPASARNDAHVPARIADSGPDAGDTPDELDPLFDKWLTFEVLEGRSSKQATPAAIAQYTASAERRARALMSARAISRRMRTDEAEGLPVNGLEHIFLVLVLWGDAVVPLDVAVKMAAVKAPASLDKMGMYAQVDWAWTLPPEDAARLAMVVLALQDETGDKGDQDRFHQALAHSLDIDYSPIMVEVKQLVRERLQLELLKQGKPVKPAAKKVVAKKVAVKQAAAKKAKRV